MVKVIPCAVAWKKARNTRCQIVSLPASCSIHEFALLCKLMWLHSQGLLFCQKSTPENVSRWATTDMGSLRRKLASRKAYPQ